MDGPWLNDLAARDNRYKFNGIERIQDNGLNMDLAPFRSYDPAIGRWWQADPIAKAWESPYAAMFNSPLNWADPMGLDPEDPERPKAPKGFRYDKEGNLMPKKTFEVTAKRENNRTLPSNLFIDGDQAYYQRGNTWYVQEHAPIEEGGTRNYGLDPRHGWVFVRSDYESYKGYVKAADNLVTAMEVTVDVGVSLGFGAEALGVYSAGLGVTKATVAGSRYLAVGSKYAGKAKKAVDAGMDLALGLNKDLSKFAGAKGFQTYRNFSKGLQLDKIEAALRNSKNRLHFNMTGFSKSQFKTFNPNGPIKYGDITNWELHTILSNPSILKRTTFYRLEKRVYEVISNPFK